LPFLAGYMTRASPSAPRAAVLDRLGAALTSSLVTRRWITTREASRIVSVTKAGEAGLREWLGVDLASLRSAA